MGTVQIHIVLKPRRIIKKKKARALHETGRILEGGERRKGGGALVKSHKKNFSEQECDGPSEASM